MSVWDDIIDAASDALPKFNSYLLKDYRKEQIDRFPAFMAMTFKEAIRLFDGEIKFRGYRILSPEERLKLTLHNQKYNQSTVDITQTEHMLVEYQFEYQKSIYTSQIYLPYTTDNAIIINGSKYYVQFALTDSVFYHITKENGIGIKVLRAHLRFWRNLYHPFTSLRGQRYVDQLIVIKAHMKNYKYNSEDIRCVLILYPLSKFGWDNTLARYGIKPEQLQLVPYADKDNPDYEYFEIRKSSKDNPGLYMKVSTDIISPNPDLSIKNQMSVVASINYVLQYFIKWPNTLYQDNLELIRLLMYDSSKDIRNTTQTPWRVILGKTLYGIDYSSEIQACSHANQHLDSLDSYLDAYTKSKLEEIGVYCTNIYELIDYVFLNMDSYIVSYSPSNLYEKRVNVLDLIAGNMVRSVFHRMYNKTNNKKGGKTLVDSKDVESLFRLGMKAINQIHKCNQVIAGNPAVYNDNYLLTVGGRKVRATHSASSGGTKASDGRAQGKVSSNQKANLINSPSHRWHPSWAYVESMLTVSHQNPGVAGSINPFLSIDKTGKIIKQDYAQDIEALGPYCLTK